MMESNNVSVYIGKFNSNVCPTPWAVESLIRWTQKEVWAQDLTVTLYCVLGKDISFSVTRRQTAAETAS